MPDIDLQTMNMLSMMEMVVNQMGDVIVITVTNPHLAKQFMIDMVEFNNKLKDYKTKEINNEPTN